MSPPQRRTALLTVITLVIGWGLVLSDGIPDSHTRPLIWIALVLLTASTIGIVLGSILQLRRSR